MPPKVFIDSEAGINHDFMVMLGLAPAPEPVPFDYADIERRILAAQDKS